MAALCRTALLTLVAVAAHHGAAAAKHELATAGAEAAVSEEGHGARKYLLRSESSPAPAAAPAPPLTLNQLKGFQKLTLSLEREKEHLGALKKEALMTQQKVKAVIASLNAYKTLLESGSATQTQIETAQSALGTEQEEVSEQVLIIKRVYDEFRLTREDTEDLETDYGDAHLIVEDGWEVSVPLPLTGIRVCHTVLRAGGASGPVPVTVYCVDCFLGLGAGLQRAISGLGSASAPEALPWRGDVAMVGFVLSAMWAGYCVFSLPSTWRDFYEDLQSFDEDLSTRMAFEAMDTDGDGYISRSDIKAFMRKGELAEQLLGSGVDADMLFEVMDTARTGYVDYEAFELFLEKVEQLQDNPEALMSATQRLQGQGLQGQGLHGQGLSGQSMSLGPMYPGLNLPLSPIAPTATGPPGFGTQPRGW